MLTDDVVLHTFSTVLLRCVVEVYRSYEGGHWIDVYILHTVRKLTTLGF